MFNSRPIIVLNVKEDEKNLRVLCSHLMTIIIIKEY